MQQAYGGYNDVDPPLPIPNREVKRVCADGTARPGGRVGSRRPKQEPLTNKGQGLFCAGSLPVRKISKIEM